MRFIRSRYILQNYRELQRRYKELIEPSRAAEHHSRVKRSINTFNMFPNRLLHFKSPSKKRQIHRRIPRSLDNIIYRELRRPLDGEEAFARFMQNIKQKYQKYVKNILGYNNIQNNSSEMSSESVSTLNPSDVETALPNVETTLPNVQTSLPNVQTALPIVSSTQAHEDVNNLHQYGSTNALVNTHPTASGQKSKQKENRNYPFIDNSYYAEERQDNNQNQYRIVNNNFVTNNNIRNAIDYSIKPNMTELIARLKAQIVRRKRNTNSENEKENRNRKRTNSNLNTTSPDVAEIDENLEGLKRGKAKGPCEVGRS